MFLFEYPTNTSAINTYDFNLEMKTEIEKIH